MMKDHGNFFCNIAIYIGCKQDSYRIKVKTERLRVHLAR